MACEKEKETVKNQNTFFIFFSCLVCKKNARKRNYFPLHNYFPIFSNIKCEEMKKSAIQFFFSKTNAQEKSVIPNKDSNGSAISI